MFSKTKLDQYINPITRKNFGWQTSNKIFRLLVNIALTSAIARNFGPENFGILSFSLTLVSIFALLTTLGTNRILQREVVLAKNIKQESEVLATILLLRGMSSWLFLLICIIVAYNFYHEVWVVIAILSFTLLFDFNEVIDLYFQSLRISKKPIILRAIAFSFGSTAKISLLILGAPLPVFSACYLAEAALGGLLLLRLMWNYRRNIKISINKNLSVSFLKESWIEVVAGFLNLLTLRSGQIFSEHFLNKEQVGYYSAAQRLSEAWFFIPLSMIASLYPVLTKAKGTDKYLLKYETLMVTIVIMTYLIIIVCYFFGEHIIRVLYGVHYSESTSTFIILIIASLFIFLGSVSGAHLSIEKKMHINMIRSFFSVAIAVAGCISFIPLYGIEAGAISTLFALFVSFFLIDIMFGSTRQTFMIKLRSLLVIPAINKIKKNIRL